MISRAKHASFSIILVLIITEITLVNCTTFKKCCAHNEILKSKSSKYVCTSEFKNNTLPLKTESSNTEYETLRTCKKETCIDKSADNKIIEMFCDTKVKKSEIKLPTIFKCCPPNMFYDTNRKSCIDDTSSVADLFVDDSASVYNLVFGVPDCTPTMVLVDYLYDNNFSINNGSLTILNDQTTYENGTYCIDKRRTQREFYIRTCVYKMDVCRNMTCVPKCCPAGQSLHKPSSEEKVRCVEDLTTPFFPNFTYEADIVGMPEQLGLLQSLNCKRYMSDTFQLFENGTLSLHPNTFLPGLDQQYCLEYLDAPIIKNYVALICFPSLKITNLDNFFYLAGCITSIIFLGITLTIYFFLPELQNLHGRTVMSHSSSLLAAYIILAFVKKPETSYKTSTCLVLGYGIMYTFLVAFAWLNVMCFDIWYTFGVVKARCIKKRNDLKKFLLYSLYAYGVPLIITGIVLYIDLFADVPIIYKPRLSLQSCWYDLRPGENHLPYGIFFAVPVGTIIFFNIVLFILTIKHCLKVRGDIHRLQHADSPKKRRFFTDRATLIMNAKLFVVMGITWIFEIISMYIREPAWLWYIFDSLNVLQGLWIFFIFVLKDNVWKALRKKLGYQVIREGSQTQSTIMSTKNSVASITSLKTMKPEEKDLLQNALRNSNALANGKMNNKDSIQ